MLNNKEQPQLHRVTGGEVGNTHEEVKQGGKTRRENEAREEVKGHGIGSNGSQTKDQVHTPADPPRPSPSETSNIFVPL
jgi:hypothetical protein